MHINGPMTVQLCTMHYTRSAYVQATGACIMTAGAYFLCILRADEVVLVLP